MKARILILGLSLTFLVGHVQALVNEQQCALRDRDSLTLPNDVALPHDNSLIYGVQLVENSSGFASELEAVRAATSRFNPVSISLDTEFIGAVLQKTGAISTVRSADTTAETEYPCICFIPTTTNLWPFGTHTEPLPSSVFFSRTSIRGWLRKPASRSIWQIIAAN